jgi:hypothetical protein
MFEPFGIAERGANMTAGRIPRRRVLILGLAGAALLAGPPAASADEQPRLGIYKVYLITGTSGSHVYDIVLLDGGHYEVREYDNSLRSSGDYVFDAAESRVRWLSGLNYDMGRGGTFTVEDGGRIHRLRLGNQVYADNGE